MKSRTPLRPHSRSFCGPTVVQGGLFVSEEQGYFAHKKQPPSLGPT